MTQSGPTTFNPLAVAQQTLDTPLARILADRIQREGPITFADWMEACLYHPQHGYYRRGLPTVGREGDFLTSPEVHPLFGAAVGHVAGELWRQAGSPEPFRIAEVGPGTGALAEATLRQLQRRLLSWPRPADTRPSSLTNTPLSPRSTVCGLSTTPTESTASTTCRYPCHLVIANELLDALPMHRLSFAGGRWHELYVDYAPALGFHEAASELSDSGLVDLLGDVEPAEGQIVEVAPERASVVSALAHAVADGGLLLLFDYGYPRDRLYAPWRRDGTLMTFRNHVPGDDPFAHPGEQDITAHIDIDQVSEAARDAGLTALPALNQAEWLHSLGAAVLPAVADAEMDTSRYLAARRAVETLTDPGGLGRIAVMGFSRGFVGPLPGWTAS